MGFRLVWGFILTITGIIVSIGIIGSGCPKCLLLQDVTSIINLFIIIRGDPPRGRLIIERTRIYSRPNALPLNLLCYSVTSTRLGGGLCIFVHLP